MIWIRSTNPVVSRIAGLSMVAVLLLAACGGSDDDGTTQTTAASTDTTGAAAPSDITVDFLQGEWYGDECNCTIIFQDGTYQVTVLHLNRELRTVDQGEVSLADGLMTFVSGSESEDCQAGEAWVARYSPLRSSDAGADRIQLSPVSEDCDDRGRGGLGWYEQLTRRP